MATNLGPNLAGRRERCWELASWHPELTVEHQELTAELECYGIHNCCCSGKTDSGLYLGLWLICAMELAIFTGSRNSTAYHSAV